MILRNLFIAIFVAFLFAGCGDNNSETAQPNAANNPTNSTDIEDNDNTVDTNGTVSLVFQDNITSVTLEENKQQVSITMRVLNSDNSPYTEGSVKVAYPDKVQNGVDVGSFVSSEVEVNEEGRVTFNYTAPKDLDARVAAGDTSTVFGFYHSSDVASIKYYTLTYSPIAGQIVLTDYLLKESSASDSYKMPLESTRQFSYYVEDSEGNKLSDSDIISMTLTLKNPILGELKDSSNNTADTLTFTAKNNVSVSLLSNTRSGVIPIDVNATFTDANGDTKNIVEVFNVTILSGPPTAMSISYEGTGHDEVNAKFQEAMVITVTDKYFNPVNTQPAVAAYMIAGYALEDETNPNTRVFFETTDPKAATMNPATNTLESSADFSNVDLHNDILLTYGNGYTYNVSGKWDIASILSGTGLRLEDTIEADANVNDIGFAIGNNYRQDVCRDGREWVGFVTLESDRLDTNGIARATINYDYYLTGKTIALGVEIIGYTAENDITSKFGEMRKHTLLSTGLEADVYTVPIGASNMRVRIPIKISGTGEYYRNGNLEPSYNVKTSTSVSLNSKDDSNGNVFDCIQKDGVVYVDTYVTNTGGTPGTVELESLSVAVEF